MTGWVQLVFSGETVIGESSAGAWMQRSRWVIMRHYDASSFPPHAFPSRSSSSCSTLYRVLSGVIHLIVL
jgi:hypothetical protein